MNNDLISREALKKELYDFLSENSTTCDWEDIFDVINNAQTVDLSSKWAEAHSTGYDVGYNKAKGEFERPQGEWIKQYGKSYELITDEGVLVGEFTKCPKCQYDKARGSNFCPNCGADMRGGAE